MTLQEGYLLLGSNLPDVLSRLGDRALLTKHLRLFCGDDTPIKLRDAVALRSKSAAWQAARSFKGTCETLGLGSLAKAVQQFMEAGDWPEREVALSRLEQEHAHALSVIGLMEDSDTALAMLAHELRAPLQAILGTAEVHQGMAGMERIALAARHMAAVLAGLTSCSPTLEPFSLPEVLRHAAALATPLCEGKHQSIAMRLDLRHDSMLGDAPRLTQALLNLLTNAARYAPENDTITLRATEIDGEVALSVEDHGPGMSKTEQQHAFKPYWRAGMSVGSGLGLTIVRKLVDLLGGTVTMDSTPGLGTTVTIRLKLTPSDAVESIGHPVEKRRHFDGLRALLAEDDLLTAEVSAELLSGLGLQTHIAHDGDEAIHLAHNRAFDCVFWDAHMPGRGASSAIQLLRASLPDTPVFALTAGVSAAEEEALRSAGIRECLLKPVDTRQLTRLLSTYFPDR